MIYSVGRHIACALASLKDRSSTVVQTLRELKTRAIRAHFRTLSPFLLMPCSSQPFLPLVT